jgi:hypothetical protein
MIVAKYCGAVVKSFDLLSRVDFATCCFLCSSELRPFWTNTVSTFISVLDMSFS